jgi:predicted lactoylglutathione lyase
MAGASRALASAMRTARISGSARANPRARSTWLSVSARAAVDAFHAAALAAGGQDNGKAGLRPQYHPNYYGAYVWDPDGHNIEAVCHDAPDAAGSS